MILTRCPHCQTVFRIDSEQIEVRDGVVRCGQCQEVFQANDHLIEIDELPAKKNDADAEEKSGTAKKHRVKQQLRRITSRLPTIDELLGREPRARTRAIFWGLGVICVVVALFGQVLYFYSDDLSQQPLIRPAVVSLCQTLHCKTSPLQDVGNIELADTQIRPHPRFKKALRIRATLINRSDFPQPYPLMEVTLTSNSGYIIARKTFKPGQYFHNSYNDQDKMPTNVAIQTRLDVTSPGQKAQNYEIQLIPNR